MALTKVTGQVIKNTTDVTVGVLTVTNTLAVGGTVSIGGTLTYEDVTNVDAVGLITARNGIVVGSGITLSKDGDIFATGVTTSTTFVGDLTGTLQTAAQGNVTSLGTLTGLTVSGDMTLTGNSANIVFDKSQDSLEFADDAVATFGDSRDLLIYHIGNNSYIQDNGVGDLYLQGNSTVRIKSADEDAIKCNANGAVELYYDNSKKIETTTAGVSVTGSATVSGDIKTTAATVNIKSGSSINTNSDTSAHGALHKNTNSGQFAVVSGGTGGNNYLSFFTSASAAPTEKLRIHADGEVEVKEAAAGQTVLSATALYSSSSNVDIATFARSGGAVSSAIRYADATTSMLVGTTTSHKFGVMTGGTERLSVLSNGKVVVGNNSAGANLSVTGNFITDDGTNARITLQADGTSTNQILSTTTGFGSYCNMKYQATNHIFLYGGTERARVRSDGGLTFNGDTAAANALDDYEEGTFTPVLDNSLSSVSYNAQVGHYTKIGNQVFGYVYLLATAGSSTSSSLRVSGLPFTSNNISYHEGGGYITYINGTFGTSGVELQAKPWVPQNATHVFFHTPEDGNNLNGNETNFANKYLIFHVRYKVA